MQVPCSRLFFSCKEPSKGSQKGAPTIANITGGFRYGKMRSLPSIVGALLVEVQVDVPSQKVLWRIFWQVPGEQ